MINLLEIRAAPARDEIIAVCRDQQKILCYIFSPERQEPIDCLCTDSNDITDLRKALLDYGYTNDDLPTTPIPVHPTAAFTRLYLKDLLTIRRPDLASILDHQLKTGNTFTRAATLQHALGRARLNHPRSRQPDLTE